MRKAFKLLTATLFAGLIASTSIMASAESFKSIWDYNNLPNGFKPGSDTDKGSSGSAYLKFASGLGSVFDATVKSNVGINGGNGLVITCNNEQGSTPEWISWDTYTDKALHPVTNVVGATDFVMWFDTTKWIYKVPTYILQGKPTPKYFDYYIDIGEYDYDNTGKLTGNITTWEPKMYAVCYLQNGTHWDETQTTTDKRIRMPKGFKGWIRLPISSLQKPDWGNYDVDNKFDGKHIVSIGCGVGFWKDNNGSSFTIANYGFLGNFASGGVPLPLDNSGSSSGSSSKSSSIKTSSSTVGTTPGTSSIVSILSGTSSRAASGISSLSSSSSISSGAESLASSGTASQDVSEGSNAQSTAKKTSSSGRMVAWIIVGVVVLLCAAGCVFYFIIRPKFLKR